MNTNQTADLLAQCNSGIQMGVTAIEDTLSSVKSGDLRRILLRSKQAHQELGSRTHALLNTLGLPRHEPSPAARAMSRLKTGFHLLADPSDGTVAELITDGCGMGIKSLRRYLNHCPRAKPESVDIARRLIDLEQTLARDVSPYL